MQPDLELTLKRYQNHVANRAPMLLILQTSASARYVT
jgi:hypothetical protein